MSIRRAAGIAVAFVVVVSTVWVVTTRRSVEESAPEVATSDSLPSALRAGIAASRAGDLARARELLESCIDLADPAIRSRVALELAIVVRKDGRIRDAVTLLSAALLDEPYSRVAYLELAQCLARVGRDSLASRFLALGELLEPGDAEDRRAGEIAEQGDEALAARFRARGFALRGQFREARETLKEAAERSVGARVYLVEHLISTWCGPEAAHELSRLGRELGAKHPDVVGWKAMLLARQAEPVEAVRRLLALLERDTRLVPLWAPRLGEILVDELERPDGAIPWLETVAANGPPSVRVLLGRALFLAERPAEAVRVFESVPSGARGAGALWHLRARIRTGEGVEGLKPELDRLRPLHGSRPEYSRALAEWLDAVGGDGRQIRDALDEARRLAAFDRQALRLLMQACRVDGDAATRLLLEAAGARRVQGDRSAAIRLARIAASRSASDQRSWRVIAELLDSEEEVFLRHEARSRGGLLSGRDEGDAAVVVIASALLADSTAIDRRQRRVTRSTSSERPVHALRSIELVDVTASSGIDFTHVAGSPEKDYILGINGGGVALLDYDGDGRLDVFLVNGSKLPPPFGDGVTGAPPSDRLYRNLGGMRFRDVTQEAGLIESGWGGGVAFADYDNDGDTDLFVTNWGPDRLWQNDGEGRFLDVSERAGVNSARWGVSAAFLDHDRDGDLDLFVVNYLGFDPRNVPRRGDDSSCRLNGALIACGPNGLPPAPCTLYRNRGDGTFEDVSDVAGVRDVRLEHATYGLGVALIDADADGWIDIYVANDTRRNLLFRNRHDGTFEEIGASHGVAYNDDGRAQSGMGVDSVFLGEREVEDLFVVNFSDDTNTFYRNEGDGFFEETTGLLGLAEASRLHLGWGTFFADIDLDGAQDLFIANGHIAPQIDLTVRQPGYRQRDQLFRQRNGRFELVTSGGSGLDVEKISRGAAYGDLDGDGDLDIVINALDDRATILENRTAPQAHWLGVRVHGVRSNRDGIGAVVSVETAAGLRRRRVRSGSSYASQSEMVARFGLGEIDRVERIRILWPTGVEESFACEAVDRIADVVEGRGTSGEE